MKKAAIIAGSVVLFLFAAVMAGEAWIKHKIRTIIEQEQPGLTSGTYRAEVGRIGVSIPARRIRLYDVYFKTSGDTGERNESKIRSVEVEAGRISLSGIRFKKRGGTYAAGASRVVLDKPVVRINVNSATADPAANDSSRHSFDMSLTLDNIGITDGDFEYVEWGEEGKMHYCAAGVRLDAVGVAYDSVFSLGDVRSFVAQARYEMERQALSLALDSVDIDTHGRSLNIGALHLTPGYPQYEYSAQVAGHPDWTQINTGAISLSGVDYGRLYTDMTVNVDSVVIASADVKSYKNRQLPQPEREKSLFFVGLQNAGFDISVAAIEVRDTDVAYEELAADGLTPGRITIDDIEGRFEGLTNMADRGERFTLDCSGMLQNSGELKALFSLPVRKGDTRFSVDGTLGAMSLASLNAMITPLSDIRVDSGEVRGMSFDIEGDITEARVEMQFLYDGLSVSLLKYREGRLVERDFVSRIIDGVLHSENPDRRGAHEASGAFVRNATRSQFNYLWKTLFSGVQHTVIGARK